MISLKACNQVGKREHSVVCCINGLHVEEIPVVRFKPQHLYDGNINQIISLDSENARDGFQI